MKDQIDFKSRISVRAVTTGIMVTLTSMFILTSLIAAFGIWNFNLNDLIFASPTFWVTITLAWIVSMYAGGYVSAVAARSRSVVEGMLNAVAVCCGSYLAFGFAFLLFAPAALDNLLNSASSQFYLRAFFGDAIAVAMGIYAGVVGAHFEERSGAPIKGQQRPVSFTS